MARTVPLAVIGRGFLKLNVILLPLSLTMLIYLGTMAGGAPNAPRPIESILIVAAFLFLAPAGLVLAHVVCAKIIDGFLRFAPLMAAEISWCGIVFSGAILVVFGNVFVDDLHQFKQGNNFLSVLAFLLDMGGMIAVVLAGGGKATDLTVARKT